MNRRLTRNAIVCLSAAGVMAVLCCSASANTERIGSSLSRWDGDAVGAGTGVQLSQVGEYLPLALTSRVNGTVTSWSVRAGHMGATYALRVLRPTGGSSFRPVGTAPAPTAIPVNTPAPGVTYEYPAAIPIQQGDTIGVDVGGTAVGLPVRNVGTTSRDVVAHANPPPPDGAAVMFTFSGGIGHELQLQATIRFCAVINVVGRTEAAAFTAVVAADCTPSVTRTPLRLRAIKKKFSKRKKRRVKAANAALRAQDGNVISQDPVGTAGTSAAPGTPVALSVGQVVKPPKKKQKKK